MRFFLPIEQQGELIPRCKYLYDVFHLCFMENDIVGGFIVLESFPFNTKDNILIIYGHNYNILYLFEHWANELQEKNIFIISCDAYIANGYMLPGKHIYLASQRKGFIYLRSGSEYGFDFDITDVELHLYNSAQKVHLDKLTSAFVRIR